ncbi:Hypothetical predicted protein [Pelobates cultripes]|uniref:Uncharacterized protein n=1 Tax=Pelobates cultripes TaxID=61616 RepID=A0AAD1SGK1_PELCU|nr:Hypothetical predicted protein [Pelobates cultripes]
MTPNMMPSLQKSSAPSSAYLAVEESTKMAPLKAKPTAREQTHAAPATDRHLLKHEQGVYTQTHHQALAQQETHRPDQQFQRRRPRAIHPLACRGLEVSLALLRYSRNKRPTAPTCYHPPIPGHRLNCATHGLHSHTTGIQSGAVNAE